ncbi:MAG: hypothetical protein ACI4X9_06550 [Kiritimatiellia bacterium]
MDEPIATDASRAVVSGLRQAWVERHLTIRSLTARLGASKREISKTETRGRRLDLAAFLCYCRVPGTRPDTGLCPAGRPMPEC